MTKFNITVMAVSLLCLVGGTAVTGEAATSFNGSTIVGVDQGQRTITFKTREGESWTLPVIDLEILTKEQLSSGDRVSIEIDLDDRITKILKSSGQSPTAQSGPRDEPGQ